MRLMPILLSLLLLGCTKKPAPVAEPAPAPAAKSPAAQPATKAAPLAADAVAAARPAKVPVIQARPGLRRIELDPKKRLRAMAQARAAAIDPAARARALGQRTAITPKARPARAKQEDIKWEGPMPWHTWEEAQALAKKKNKRIFLLVYADWCPKCRALAPVFGDPEVVKAASGLVMVRQDGDQKPAWLQRYASYGGYVPRAFFLKPDLSVDESLTSGNARFPYFYVPAQKDLLIKNMRAASAP